VVTLHRLVTTKGSHRCMGGGEAERTQYRPIGSVNRKFQKNDLSTHIRAVKGKAEIAKVHNFVHWAFKHR
jgi:hypothetical protein